MLIICTNNCFINKTVHFVTYCISVVWDYRINTYYFPQRISIIGRILREAGINFVLVGLCSTNYCKSQFSKFQGPRSALIWRE
jgi:hypothetical protein